MLLAHLSDLHLRDDRDLAAFERQLDCIAASRPAHTAITGDLLDRWNPPLLERALDALERHGLFNGDQLTILHGNHDLSSSGGHPRRRADLWRLVLRFWDPPLLLQRRRRQFYRALERRAIDVRALRIASQTPYTKTAPGLRLVVLDSVTESWRPLSVAADGMTLHHGAGALAPRQSAWLAAQRGESPLVVLMHHYPLPVPPFAWRDERLPITFRVPMAIAAPDRDRFWAAARDAGVSLVLCGHVHRARLEHHDGIAIGLNGQSGAEWAGRTIAFYELDGRAITMRVERT